jgi:hypothetical protein
LEPARQPLPWFALAAYEASHLRMVYVEAPAGCAQAELFLAQPVGQTGSSGALSGHAGTILAGGLVV